MNGYNAYGELETEAISGLYVKTLTHHFDAYGRNVGYSVNGSRRTFLGYDGDTGRIAAMNEGGDFHWEYLPGSDLKARLTYPNGLAAEWAYEPERDLLTAVTNSLPNGTTLSTYVYANDLLGRRTSKNDEQYGYNVRDELISGQGLTYAYDDIGIYAPTSVSEVGNRTAAEGRTYAANSLNQYTAIDTFGPEYDADGNQTRVLTSTGEWTVEYNAENRPVRWTQDGIVITMAYDRMGRRVEYRETRDGAHYMHAKYVYDGYLCVQRLYGATGRVYQAFAWDPTEPVATRPLMLQVPDWGSTLFYAHDGNKNVSEVFYYALGINAPTRVSGVGHGIAAHYDYAPFGAVIRTAKSTPLARDILSENPFRFSSEVHDNSLGLVYYNYRHYNPKDGRWLGRDLIESCNQYLALLAEGNVDYLGLWGIDLSSLLGEPPAKPGAREKDSINCLGYALGENELVRPEQGQDLHSLMTAMGWTESETSDCDCETIAVIKLYVIVAQQNNKAGCPNPLSYYKEMRQKILDRANGDPFTGAIWDNLEEERYDFHAIRQDCDEKTGKGKGWTFLPGTRKKVSDMAIWNRSDEYYYRENLETLELPRPGYLSNAQVVSFRYYRKMR